MAWAERRGLMVLHVSFSLLVLRQAASVTTPPVQECDASSTGSNKSIIPVVVVVVVVFVFLIVVISGVICYKRRLKHGSSQGIAASGEPRESPGIRDNPTFESPNVQDLQVTDVAGYHSGNDPYMALTTPHDGPTVQKYETLSKVISQGDGYEVPVNGADRQTGPEYSKTLYKLQVHPETDYEITHEYQDITNGVVGRKNSRNESPIRGLQVQPETDYGITHEYQDPGVVGANIPQYESHIDGLQEMSKTDYEAIHEYEDPCIIG
eukprot:XP_011676738.1 PREDICTED: uncharacterized protein LOC105444334 [Strongylocentrotus purpuratus]